MEELLKRLLTPSMWGFAVTAAVVPWALSALARKLEPARKKDWKR
ncbi:hypothetical protein ACTHPH_02675 [Paenibacillus pasadenensis]|uniref:Uncharacterized protein n=1 Tax=Paenibacillus pasadenensis TaxID=217090 RepID=A0A2N5N6Y3_9BACL|nr:MULTISPECIES: hypothetical protein [Paenibacillus]PLT46075.1 hypothetical protein B8V81_4506 [Paenibacillus pasadenensis]